MTNQISRILGSYLTSWSGPKGIVSANKEARHSKEFLINTYPPQGCMELSHPLLSSFLAEKTDNVQDYDDYSRTGGLVLSRTWCVSAELADIDTDTN